MKDRQKFGVWRDLTRHVREAANKGLLNLVNLPHARIGLVPSIKRREERCFI